MTLNARVPYVEDPEDAALLRRALRFYELPVIEAIGHVISEAWNGRSPNWRSTGRRVPPYLPGDYRRTIDAFQ